ncbi:MAG: transcriptional regulator [Verrucomicrobia bacterium]|mgnify:FL=1|jgi:HTH-type transcriptional regulator, glycine betaine synthesis regulator|nr:transcriptional regulator [Verrucomicrobiota bacterium]
MTTPAPTQPTVTGLSPAEREIIELFVQLAAVISYPRSIGELYGMLFLSPDPLTADALIERLGMSKGSASQGLKVLRTLGAIKSVYMPGDRRGHYQAELNLRRIIGGFMQQQVAPNLADANARLTRIDGLLKSDNDPKQEWLQSRLTDLHRWSKHSEKLAPVVAKLFGNK